MTTTPAMPDLTAVIKWLENGCDPREAVKELKHYQSKLQALATLQAQPAAKCDGNHGGPRCADPECWNDDPQAQPAEVSDAEINQIMYEHTKLNPNQADDVELLTRIRNAVRAILALRPQSESEQEKELRRSLAEAQATISERNAEIIELQKRIHRSPQAVPMTDEPQSAPKLIGWRTENFLWETDDVDKARNWEPNIGVLPIFEGDPNTKLGSRGITAQGAQGEQG